MSTTTTTAAAISGGDVFRAKMRDEQWIRDSEPGALRAAVHALCWRASRSTIEGFSSVPDIAEKVLIITRGIVVELDSRINVVGPSITDRPNGPELPELHRQLASLRRRKATAESIIAACDSSLALARMRSGHRCERSAEELVAAIAEHRRQTHPDTACQADVDLWGVLDETHTPNRLIAQSA